MYGIMVCTGAAVLLESTGVEEGAVSWAPMEDLPLAAAVGRHPHTTPSQVSTTAE